MNIKKFISRGTEGRDKSLAQHIEMSNGISLVLSIIIAAPFVVLTWIYAPPVLIIPVLGLFVGPVAILTAKRFNIISRMIVSVAPISLVTWYHAALLSEGEASLTPMVIMGYAFLLLPALIWDLKAEWGWALIPLAISCFYIIGLELINVWLEVDYDMSVFKTGWLYQVSLSLSIVSGVVPVVVLTQVSKKYQKDAELALNQSKESEDKMKAQQKNLQAASEELEKRLIEIDQQRKLDRVSKEMDDQIIEINNFLNSNEDLTIGQILNEILRRTVKFLGATQGAIFVHEEENELVRLTAKYAYERIKYVEGDEGDTYKFAEGLVGRCWAESKPVQITEIPKGYLTVTSGLGEALPKNLLLYPIQNSTSFVGVIEVSSFKEVGDDGLSFLKRLNDVLSNRIIMTVSSIKTNELLTESEQMREEMQAQEEELRQNSEELMATQEELSRKVQVLEEQLAAKS